MLWFEWECSKILNVPNKSIVHTKFYLKLIFLDLLINKSGLCLSYSEQIFSLKLLILTYNPGNFAGQLYELDGRRAGPVSHGASSSNTILQVMFILLRIRL